MDFLLFIDSSSKNQKAYLLKKTTEEISGKKNMTGEWTSTQKKEKTERTMEVAEEQDRRE